jgi:hypothetical protein
MAVDEPLRLPAGTLITADPDVEAHVSIYRPDGTQETRSLDTGVDDRQQAHLAALRRELASIELQLARLEDDPPVGVTERPNGASVERTRIFLGDTRPRSAPRLKT